MPAKVYTDKDADLNVLRNKTLAVLGFGSQGHAHALNLKESGMDVLVGLREGASWQKAERAGLKVMPGADAASEIAWTSVVPASRSSWAKPPSPQS